jgi:hypothetical protein
MGKTNESDIDASPPQTQQRSREEVLRDVRHAIAQSSNYGREARRPGSNPYDSELGRPQRDIWAVKKRAP